MVKSGLDEDTYAKPTPAILSLLHKDVEGMQCHQEWSYRSAVGMLTYLQGTTRLDISIAVHQSFPLNNNPMLSHEMAIKRILWYLVTSKDCTGIFKPNMKKGIECFVDEPLSFMIAIVTPDIHLTSRVVV